MLRRFQIHARSEIVGTVAIIRPVTLVRHPLEVSHAVIDGNGRFWLRECGQSVGDAVALLASAAATIGIIACAAAAVAEAGRDEPRVGALASAVTIGVLLLCFLCAAFYLSARARRKAPYAAWAVPDAFEVVHPRVRVHVRVGTDQFPHTSDATRPLLLKRGRGRSFAQLLALVEWAIAATTAEEHGLAPPLAPAPPNSPESAARPPSSESVPTHVR